MRYIVNHSPWPLFLAINVGCCCLNLISVNHFIPSLLPLVITLLLWSRDFYLESKAGQYPQVVYSGLKLSFLGFLLTETMYFVALFWCSLSNMLSPTLSMWPSSFIDSPQSTLPILATLLLLGSSVSATACHHFQEAGLILRSRIMLFLTIVLGMIFLPTTFLEFYTSGFTMSDGIYGSIFYMIIGTHLLHVIVGLVVLLLSKAGMTRVYALYYWHFVDFIWLIVVVLSYQPHLLVMILLGGCENQWNVKNKTPEKDTFIPLNYLSKHLFLSESDGVRKESMIRSFLSLLHTSILLNLKERLAQSKITDDILTKSNLGHKFMTEVKKIDDLLCRSHINTKMFYPISSHSIRSKLEEVLNFNNLRMSTFMPLHSYNLTAFVGLLQLDNSFQPFLQHVVWNEIDNSLRSTNILYNVFNIDIKHVNVRNIILNVEGKYLAPRPWNHSMVITQAMLDMPQNRLLDYCNPKMCELGFRMMSYFPYQIHMSDKLSYIKRKWYEDSSITTAKFWVAHLLKWCYVYHPDTDINLLPKGVSRPVYGLRDTSIIVYWNDNKLMAAFLPTLKYRSHFDRREIYHTFPVNHLQYQPLEAPFGSRYRRATLNL